jgi:hypothetical protein
MGKRSDSFIADLESTNTGKVYFQPPSSVQLNYPCWVVERSKVYQPKANDKTYLFRPGYKCMYMNCDEPDPEVLEMISRRYERCQYQNHYVVDNVHHDVFLIYY